MAQFHVLFTHFASSSTSPTGCSSNRNDLNADSVCLIQCIIVVFQVMGLRVQMKDTNQDVEDKENKIANTKNDIDSAQNKLDQLKVRRQKACIDLFDRRIPSSAVKSSKPSWRPVG